MDLLKLRPSDNTAVALRRALDAAEAAQITVAAELDKARQARDGLLLDGTQADLTRAERTLCSRCKSCHAMHFCVRNPELAGEDTCIESRSHHCCNQFGI